MGVELQDISRRVDSSILAELHKRWTNCSLCPHQCGVNREKGEQGKCRSGSAPRIASRNRHRGEEPPISGIGGSGTIFFSGCSLRCIYCQNYPISQMGTGSDATAESLSEMMLWLEKKGCENINLVTPTHFLYPIAEALDIAFDKGLSIPIVCNGSGYALPEIVELIAGFTDIFMPDMKYTTTKLSKTLSNAPDYPQNNKEALKKMVKLKGDLQLDARGVAKTGVLVRHLVIPSEMENSKTLLEWFSETIASSAHISVMFQYFPAHNAVRHDRYGRSLSHDEIEEIRNFASELNNIRGWIQDETIHSAPIPIDPF